MQNRHAVAACLVLCFATGWLWVLGSGYALLAAVTVGATGPVTIHWPWLLAGIAAATAVPLSFLGGALWKGLRPA